MKTFSVLLLAASAVVLLTASTATQSKESKESTPTGNLEHGRYLVERVVMCAECHSPRDEKGDIIQDQRFEGAPIPFRPPWPNDWAIAAPRNRGLPGYTVEQGIRLLTQGAIARDGHQLRLPMPRFRMTPQDAADVVAYFKSME
jgi:mono/diheme cytochrome c family protein